MFLSDQDIEKELQSSHLEINPLTRPLQPASVDLHLSRHFRSLRSGQNIWPDTKAEYTEIEDQTIALRPGEFILGSTIERIAINCSFILGRLEGKSSRGRIGLAAHVTAGFFDPGFRGHATLELVNVGSEIIFLEEGMSICQMSFAYLQTSSFSIYGDASLNSKYQNQGIKPEGSKHHTDRSGMR